MLPEQELSLTLSLGRLRKTSGHFMWRHPKHEFYYAFNKLLMQLHVVCSSQIQTDVFVSVVEREREWEWEENCLGKLCVWSGIFSSNCRVHVCLMWNSVDYVRRENRLKALKTETVVLSSTAFCNTENYSLRVFISLRCLHIAKNCFGKWIRLLGKRELRRMRVAWVKGNYRH